jgi:hypothetical protein
MSLTLLTYLHWVSILFFFTMSSIMLWYGGRSKILNMGIGFFTLTLLVTGLLMSQKLGLAFWGEWTWWIKTKLILWLFLAMLVPVVVKRAPKLGKLAYIIMMASGLFIFKIVLFKN